MTVKLTPCAANLKLSVAHVKLTLFMPQQHVPKVWMV